jgi:hypothetical protein
MHFLQVTVFRELLRITREKLAFDECARAGRCSRKGPLGYALQRPPFSNVAFYIDRNQWISRCGTRGHIPDGLTVILH